MNDDLIGYTIAFISIFIFSIPYVLLLIDKFTGNHFSCTYFGWHNGNGGERSFDGASITACCSKCRKEVMMDSQGNWF